MTRGQGAEGVPDLVGLVKRELQGLSQGDAMTLLSGASLATDGREDAGGLGEPS